MPEAARMVHVREKVHRVEILLYIPFESKENIRQAYAVLVGEPSYLPAVPFERLPLLVLFKEVVVPAGR